MTQDSHTPPILLAILGLNLVNSHQLFRSWIDSPLEKNSWLLFLIWLMPLAFQLAWKRHHQHRFSNYNVFLEGMALLAAVMSLITSLNALAYSGLALALAAYMPKSWGNRLWLASAVVWMPAFGWLLSHQIPRTAPMVTGQLFRLLLIICGVICSLVSTKNHHENPHG